VARLLIIANKSESITELSSALTRKGHHCSIFPYEKSLIESIIEKPPDLILLEIDKHISNAEIQELLQDIKLDRLTSVVTLTTMEINIPTDLYLKVDDFLVSPYSISELELRIQRILHRNNIIHGTDLFEYKGLVIDPAKCEVTVEGSVVKLTFKEYELLKFLALGKGHVYTRETLLNKVWGYGYYGGDRTVDVHIRRLRSKIEDTNHTFIETVINIGYRFLTD
jgi:two-component system alkaline phosphatase synthesis response regulator PhoP